MKKLKKENNYQKTKEWKKFTLEEYQKAASEMVHFSSKTINSNTLSFGIRLGENIRLSLKNPYIAVSAMDRSKIPLDHIKTAAASSIVKQINSIRYPKTKKDWAETVPHDDIQTISNCFHILDSSYEASQSIGIRLRQIILQDENGNDVSATPLACAGLSSLINTRIFEEYEKENPIDKAGKRPNKKSFISRKRVYLEIGGSNPINVGLNAHTMQRPIMFEVPSRKNISREVRKALSIYHKGISIEPDLSLLKDFILWQETESNKRFTRFFSDMEIHKKIEEFLIEITNRLLSKAKEAEKTLRKYIDKLPKNKEYPDIVLYSEQLPLIQQGLLDKNLRSSEWRYQFADELHSKIIFRKVWINNTEKSLNVGKYETANWASIIERTTL